MPMVELKKVTQRFGRHVILDTISLSVEKGGFVFLVGKSGAGKTTILRMLYRDLLPSKGEVLIGGIDVTKIHPQKVPLLRRKIGIIFQDFRVLFDQTVFENVAVTLEIFDRPKAEIDKKVTEVLELVKLSDKKHLFPLQLSAGELQRVAIARAIVGGPHVLLADEPTGNLDPKTSIEIMRLLSQINRLGTTVIMATHNADIVNTMKKRVVTIVNGKITKDQKQSGYD